jgi:alpha-tubulin suppressor-like RCC1 family protein
VAQVDGSPNQDAMGDALPPLDAGPTAVVHIAVGMRHACALLDNGAVRCWGEGSFGRLGYANEDDIGDDETPASVGDVDVGGQVIQLAAGQFHTCALLVNKKVRCWGRNTVGQLGYGNGYDAHVGDDETPASAGDVPVGADVIQIAAWRDATCAVTVDNNLRCWGADLSGMLGYPGESASVGDNEPVSQLGDVPLGTGVKVSQVAVGNSFVCVRRTTGAVRCWGRGRDGRLGYADDFGTVMVGQDIEPTPIDDPTTAPDVSIGGSATDLDINTSHACVVLDGGTLRCWGSGTSAKLGTLSAANVGETNYPSDGALVKLNGTASKVVTGAYHTCALLTNKEARCWGDNTTGVLGYGNTIHYGWSADPTVAVPVGGDVEEIDAGETFTCARLSDGTVRCWGQSPRGQLGYGNTDAIGLSETPASAGPVPVF